MNAKQEDKSKSFYFFDFDDNIMFLSTPILIKNTKTNEDKEVSTSEFAEIRMNLGKDGDWKDFALYEDTYSHFRDISQEELKAGKKQWFVQDVEKAVRKPTEGEEVHDWRAPSWDLFVYACREQRPLAIVTARGHSRETIKAGIRVLLEKGLIDEEPNYLAIYPVGNDKIQNELRKELSNEPSRELSEELIQKLKDLKNKLDEPGDHTSELKRIAIWKIVDKALEDYGAEPEHRFGMSDDDPQNVDLIIKAMCDCKKKYLDKRFFVIDTHEGEKVKLEVFPPDYPVTRRVARDEVVG